MGEIENTILGVIIFIAFIGAAFEVSILFGIIFILGVLYSLYSGTIQEKPGIPIAIFTGGLITRIATSDFFLPIFKSKTIFDFVVAIFTFLLIYLIGHQVKQGDT